MANNNHLLFEFIKDCNLGRMEAIDELSDQEVKDLKPYVLTMWINGCSANRAANVVYNAMHYNPVVFKLGKHPRLLLNVFMACVIKSGGCGRISFVKAVSGSSDMESVAKHLEIQPHEVNELISFGLLTLDDVKEIKEMYKVG